MSKGMDMQNGMGMDMQMDMDMPMMRFAPLLWHVGCHDGGDDVANDGAHFAQL